MTTRRCHVGIVVVTFEVAESVSGSGPMPSKSLKSRGFFEREPELDDEAIA